MSRWLEEEIVTKAADDLVWQGLYEKAMDEGALEGKFTADVTYKDGMLYRKGKIWVPNVPSLRKQIMESEHDSWVAGHMGMDKTSKLIV